MTQPDAICKLRTDAKGRTRSASRRVRRNPGLLLRAYPGHFLVHELVAEDRRDREVSRFKLVGHLLGYRCRADGLRRHRVWLKGPAIPPGVTGAAKLCLWPDVLRPLAEHLLMLPVSELRGMVAAAELAAPVLRKPGQKPQTPAAVPTKKPASTPEVLQVRRRAVAARGGP